MSAVDAPIRLPIWTVIRRSFAYSWESRAVLLQPFLIYAAATMAIDWVVQYAIGTQNAAVNLAVAMVELLLGMAFAVGIHRFVLLGEAANGLRFFRWDRNLAHYAATAFPLLVGMAALFLVGVGFGAQVGNPAAAPPSGQGTLALVQLAMLAVFAAAAMALARLSLTMPAAAIDDKIGLGAAWRASRANGFRIVTAAFLIVTPFMLADALLSPSYFSAVFQAMENGADTSAIPPPDIVIQAILGLLGPLELVILVVMLSLCYDLLVRGGGPARQGGRRVG